MVPLRSLSTAWCYPKFFQRQQTHSIHARLRHAANRCSFSNNHHGQHKELFTEQKCKETKRKGPLGPNEWWRCIHLTGGRTHYRTERCAFGACVIIDLRQCDPSITVWYCVSLLFSWHSNNSCNEEDYLKCVLLFTFSSWKNSHHLERGLLFEEDSN